MKPIRCGDKGCPSLFLSLSLSPFLGLFQYITKNTLLFVEGDSYGNVSMGSG